MLSGYTPQEIKGSAAGRAQQLVVEYKQAFELVIAPRLHLSAEVIDKIKEDPSYAACLEGKLSASSEGLVTPFSMPFVLVKRLVSISEQLHLLRESLDLPRHEPLFTHAAIQFMRVYASHTSFSSKFYANPLLEWLIAQCVELSAILRMTATRLSAQDHAATLEAARWIQGNVAFCICFARGIHFSSVLQDFESGISNLKAAFHETTGHVSVSVSSVEESLSDIFVAIKGQIESLESRESGFMAAIKAAEGDGAPQSFLQRADTLILSASWRTVTALCISPKRIPDLELVVAPLLRVFQRAHREMDLIHWAIDKDMGEAVNEAAQLFRLPSAATRLLRCVFFSEPGVEFLQLTLRPILKKLWKQKIEVELDPNRLPFGLDEQAKEALLKHSAKTVMSIAENIVAGCAKNVDRVPVPIRKFLLYARNTFMGTHKGGSRDETLATKLVVASLFFLRFIGPSIVAPCAFGIVDTEPPQHVQRVLVLVTKILQNAASGVEFDGTKESYMTACNPFVVSHQKPMMKLFFSLIDSQAIGARELQAREKSAKEEKRLATGSKRDILRMIQEDWDSKTRDLHDIGLLVNEFCMKRSFVPMIVSQGADELCVRSIRALIRADVTLHDSEGPLRMDAIISASLKLVSPYASSLQATLLEMAQYLPPDLQAFRDEGETAATADLNDQTLYAIPLVQPMMMLDDITSRHPSRLSGVARTIREVAQRTWEIATELAQLSGFSGQKFKEVIDQESPVALISREDAAAAAAAAMDSTGGSTMTEVASSDDTETNDDESSSSTPKHPKSKLSSNVLGGGRSSSASSELPAVSSPTKSSSKRDSLISRASRSWSIGSAFRVVKSKGKIHSYTSDEALFWGPSLVIPQVLGLLHCISILRQVLKHARLENRIVPETAEVDRQISQCVFECSSLVKNGGVLLLNVCVNDPSSAAVGPLALGLANGIILLSRAILHFMHLDRQIIRASKKSSPGKKKADVGGDGDSFSEGDAKKRVTRKKTSKSPKKAEVENLAEDYL